MVRSMRSDADGSIDTSIMLHKGELFKRKLDEHDELDDFEKLEEFAVETDFAENLQMQSTPARVENHKMDVTPPDSGRSGDTEIVHSPGKGIFRNKETNKIDDSDDELSWNLQPLKIDNLLPPDLDLTVEDEEKTIENIPIQDLQTPKSSQNTDFPLADDVSRIVQEKIDQLNIEIEKFQKQSKRVEIMKSDCNKQSLLLQKSKNELKMEFEEKEAKFESYCAEEMNKIRREKRKLEELGQTIKLQGNRQARQLENQTKIEVQGLKDQMKDMEKRYHGNLSRLREQMRNLEEEKSDLSDQLKVVSEENLKLQEKCRIFERKKLVSGDTKSSWEEINELVSKPANKPVVINETKFNQKNTTNALHSGIPQKPIVSSSQTTVDSYQTAVNTSAGSNSQTSQISPTSTNSQVDRISERDPDGTRRIRFLNTGTVKTVEPSGIITVKFANGDVKTCYPEGLEKDLKKDVYFYCDTRTTETTFYDNSNKSKIITFDDGQTEHYYRDGKKEIAFNDHSKRIIECFNLVFFLSFI